MYVAIIEDNLPLLENLKILLGNEEEITVVGAFGSAEDALHGLKERPADVILVDLGLPGMSGIEFIKRIRTDMPETNIMVYTVFDNWETVFSAIKAGATGYILKGTSPRELVEAIRNLHQGGAPMSPKIARMVITDFRSETSGNERTFSDREREILDGVNTGRTYKEIAETLQITPSEVRAHIKNIYRKLHAQNSHRPEREGTRTSIGKIARPKISDVFRRKRLFHQLDQARRCPVTWISGPAGSGKTTLIASYLDQKKLPCLWYQVDEGDSDIATFFYYMGLAGKKAAPRIEEPLPLLTPEYALGIPKFTRRFFEYLYHRLSPPFVLVFDNYQLVSESTPLNQIMQIGLSMVPDGITVFMISRSEPVPEFARLQANNHMEVIGWEDLRLTVEESHDLIRSEGGDRLSPEEVKRIHEKAGGWAAGLILLAKTVHREGEERRVEGGLLPEQVFDYFANELFDSQPEGLKDVLLKTSLVPRITPRIAEELTGNRDAAAILSELNRRNYFTEKRLSPSLSYQFHPLFREFLAARANKVFSPADLAGMRLKSARLFEDSEQVEDAAELYIQAREWNGLASLLVRHAQGLVSQGRNKTLHEWLSCLPHEMLERTPWLLYWMGICHFPSDYEESRRYFEQAFRIFDASRDVLGVLLAWSTAVDTIIYEFGDLKRLEPWIAWFSGFERKHNSYPSPDVEYRAVTSMAVALMFSGRGADEIAPWVERGIRLMHACPDRNVQIQSGAYFALFYLWQGDLDKMGEVVKDQKRWTRGAGVTPLNIAAAYFTEALYHWMTAYPDFGIKASCEGIALSAANGIHQIDNHLFAQKLIGSLSIGDLTMAEEVLRLIESITKGAEKRFLVNYHYFYLSAWKSLLKGDFSAAYHESMDSLRLLDEMGGSGFHRAYSNVTAAQALLTLEQHDEAHKHITRVKKIASDMDSPLIEWSGFLLEAQEFFDRASSSVPSQSEPLLRQGLSALAKALAIAKKKHYVNTIAWYPPAVARLCVLALEHGIEPEYARQLIRRRNLVPEQPPLAIENWPWSLRIKALGMFELRQEDKPVTFSGKVQKKPLELLKALLAFGGKDVPEERLTEALWPDAEGDTARISFKTTLHRLRKLLKNDEIITFQEGRVGLDPRHCWVDAWAFEDILRDAETRGKGETETEQENEKKKKHSSPRRPVALSPAHLNLKKALDLYKGHFLSGEVEQPWMISYRERLRTKFLGVISELGNRLEHSCSYREALDVYERGLEVDDLVEEFYQGIMRNYQKLGRRAEVARVYERCRKKLHSTLGINPSPETEEIFKTISKTK